MDGNMKNYNKLIFLFLILFIASIVLNPISAINSTDDNGVISNTEDLNYLDEVNLNSEPNSENDIQYNSKLSTSNENSDIICSTEKSFSELDPKIQEYENVYLYNSYYSTSDYEHGLHINKSVTIYGNDNDLNGKDSYRIFFIQTGNVIINNINFINGFYKGNDTGAGAIWNEGNLTLINCNFYNNKAGNGGSIVNFGTLTLINCSFSCNSANLHGGAIWNGNTLNITNTEFYSNRAGENAGAIWNIGDLTIRNCDFNSNHASYGGAIAANEGTINIYDSEFYDNSVSNNAGAISLGGDSLKVFIKNSIFIYNRAEYCGALINTGELTLENCNFESNINNNNEEYGAVLSYGTIHIKDCNFSNNAGCSAGYSSDLDSEFYISLGNKYYGDIFNVKIGLVPASSLHYLETSIYIDNKFIKKYIINTNGEQIANFGTSLKVGKHTFSIKCKNFEIIKTFTIYKAHTKFSVSQYTFTTAYNKILKITLKNNNGYPAISKTIKFKINGKTYSSKTNSLGVASIKLKIHQAGNYKCLVSFAGDSSYYEKSIYFKLRVKKTNTKVKAPKVTGTHGTTKYFKITVKNMKNKAVKNLKLKVKVAGKTYKIKTNSKGMAKFNIKNLKKGTHKVVINSKNSKFYVKKTSKVKIKAPKKVKYTYKRSYSSYTKPITSTKSASSYSSSRTFSINNL